MRYLLNFLILLSFSANAQFIEVSFPAPSENISGLAFAGHVWALDSLDCVIYGVNGWTGELFETVILPPLPNPPVGLGMVPSTACDTFWLAESGAAIVHSIDSDGNLLGTWDFSDSGIQCISGLEIGPALSFGYLMILDSSDRSIYTVKRPFGSEPVEYQFTISDDIEVHGIGWDEEKIPVACNDEVSPVHFYYDATSYESLGDGDYASAVGVASVDCSRIYFSDPDMGMIHRYCVNMGGVEEESYGISNPVGFGVYPNPVRAGADAYLSLHLASEGCIAVQLYDVRGRIITGITTDLLIGGFNEILLGSFSPGIYFCSFTSGDFSATQRFVVVE